MLALEARDRKLMARFRERIPQGRGAQPDMAWLVEASTPRNLLAAIGERDLHATGRLDENLGPWVNAMRNETKSTLPADQGPQAG